MEGSQGSSTLPVPWGAPRGKGIPPDGMGQDKWCHLMLSLTVILVSFPNQSCPPTWDRPLSHRRKRLLPLRGT